MNGDGRSTRRLLHAQLQLEAAWNYLLGWCSVVRQQIKTIPIGSTVGLWHAKSGQSPTARGEVERGPTITLQRRGRPAGKHTKHKRVQEDLAPT